MFTGMVPVDTFSLSLLTTMAQTFHAQNLGTPFPRKKMNIRRIEKCWKGFEEVAELFSLSLSPSTLKGALVTHPSSAFPKELPSILRDLTTPRLKLPVSLTHSFAWYMDSPTYSGPALPMTFTHTWGVPLRMLEIAEVAITTLKSPVGFGLWEAPAKEGSNTNLFVEYHLSIS